MTHRCQPWVGAFNCGAPSANLYVNHTSTQVILECPKPTEEPMYAVASPCIKVNHCHCKKHLEINVIKFVDIEARD